MVGIPATVTGVGGWTVGPVVGRRPAGVARDAVHPGTGARGVLIVVDGRFTGRGLPDPDLVQRAAVVGSPVVMPMLDAGLLEDGTRWYVTPPSPGPVLDPSAGCSPRRAAAIVEAVARGLAAVHAAGLVHGLIGPEAVVPALGRHAERPVSSTLLLDTGVAALLGDRAGELAQTAGVSLPRDRGPAADVHALGALLLRLLTAAAPAGPALAALPVPLRALLSAMLDEDPVRRPTAEAVARSLGGMREGLLGTGPLDVPRAPVPVPAPVPLAAAAAPEVTAPPQDVVPRIVVPAPVPAPLTLESPIVVPISRPAQAPSLWTGAVPVTAPARPARRGVRRVLLLAGGVGLAGLVVGVVTHLPLGSATEERAVAATAQHGVLADAATRSPDGTTAPSSAPAAASPAPKRVAAAPPPSFVRTSAAVPSPLAASASSPTPSRNTSSAPTRTASTTPTASGSTGSRSATAPTSSQSTSDPVSSAAPSAPTGAASSAPASSAEATTTAPDSTQLDATPPGTPTPPDTTSPDTTSPDTTSTQHATASSDPTSSAATDPAAG